MISRTNRGARFLSVAAVIGLLFSTFGAAFAPRIEDPDPIDVAVDILLVDEGTVVLGDEHVHEVTMAEGDLWVVYDDAGAARLEHVTADHLGQQLAIAIDGEIVATPVVMDVITGGTVRVDL